MSMKELRSVGTSLGALSIVAFATTAGAVNITGTWEGKEQCRCVNNIDGKFTEQFNNEEMEITQSGADLNIRVFAELFNGNVIGNPKDDNRGDATFIACRTDPRNNASFGETGSAQLRTKGNGAGSLEVQSLWNVSATQICKCTWHFKRTETADPLVPGCPPL